MLAALVVGGLMFGALFAVAAKDYDKADALLRQWGVRA